MGRAARSQCASSHSWSRHDQALWHPGTLCHLARVGDGLTPPGRPLGPFFSDTFAASSGTSWPFFLAFSSSSASLAPIPLILLSLTGSPSSSERLSPLRSGLALPQARCAIRGYARNGGGDYYTSDGDVLVINYTQAPIPLNQSVWVIDGLKTGVFLLYDTLFTVVGALIAFLALVVVLIAGLVLWRLTKRNRTVRK